MPEMCGKSAEERDNEDDEFKVDDSEANDENEQYINTVKTIA